MNEQPLTSVNGMGPAGDRRPRLSAVSGPATEPGGTTAQSSSWDVLLQSYRELFDLGSDGFLGTDLQGIILEVNQSAAALLRTRREFLLRKPFPLFVTEGHRTACYSLLLLLQQGGSVRDWHTTLQALRGVRVEVLVSATGVTNTAGRLAAFRWQLRDVSSSLTAERALRAERDFTESLLDCAQAIVLVLDEAGHILRTNPYLHRLTGRENHFLRGRSWAHLLPEKERPAALEMVEQARLFGLSSGFSGGLFDCDGVLRRIIWSARSLNRGGEAAARGGFGTVLVVGHDVTELQAARQQVEQSRRLATIGQVMASLAHESRNLLQRSQACLERLSWRLEDRPEALELVSRARQAQYDLVHLLEDVRAYAAPLVLDLAPCDVRAAWREAWAQVVTVCPSKQAELHEAGGDADVWCVADRFRLLQVFRNLIENSFAVCTGLVRVKIECREVSLAGGAALEVALRDNGPGFAPEQRRRLFEPFYTTRPQGSGLGLVLAKRILEAHGGSIQASDHGPPGAEIIVTLPRDRP
jgi:PAS domain S-box-containing protein